MRRKNFDVVVIGGGSAGCVLAGHLVEHTELKVCLIEAGPDYGPFDGGRWPSELLDPRFGPDTHDWGYSESRARVIGGCSTHNQCAAIWPVPEDFDRIAQAGNPGWSYADIKPLIDEIELDLSPVKEPYRGHHGLLPTRPYDERSLSSWHRLFIEASLAAGFPRMNDLSAPEPPLGVMPFHANVKNGVRWNASFAFLDPVRGKPNLTILDRTMVDRLILEGEMATELVCKSRGETLRLRAATFVLAAGAFGSPAILIRSGIGPADHLKQLGIKVRQDLAVGENLQDHPGVSITFEPETKFARVLDQEQKLARLYESQVNGRGRSSHSETSFDLHFMSYQTIDGSGKPDLELLAFHMDPRSRGRVKLAGKDPRLAPIIDFRYLTDQDEHDLDVLTDAFHLLRRLSQTEPLASAIKRETEPGSRKKQEKQISKFVRETVGGYSHAAGTCKIGPSSDPAAVVDPVSAHVYGTQNIHVADASIIPIIPCVNTNLLCMLVGKKLGMQIAAVRI